MTLLLTVRFVSMGRSYCLLPARIICAVILTTLNLGSAQLRAQPKTDKVTLYRGDTITGSIKGLSHGRLDYKTDDLDRVSIEWSKIARIQSKHLFEIELTNATKYVGRIDSVENDGEMIIVTETQRVYLKMPSVVSITPLGTNFLSRLTGSISLGFDITQTNNQIILSTNTKIVYRTTKRRVSLLGSTYLNRQKDLDASVRNSYTISGQRFIKGSHWTGLALVGAEQNDELSLLHRWTAGLGSGFFFLNTNRTSVEGLSGIATTNEQYSNGEPSSQSFEALIGLLFDFFRYHDPKLIIDVSIDCYVGLTDWGRFRPHVNTSVTWKAFADFTLGLTGYFQADTRPAEGANQLDYSISTTFGYTWD